LATYSLLNADATLAPPSLQDPIQLGADPTMESGTKYIGGHSNMLCGIAIIPADVHDGLLSSSIKISSAISFRLSLLVYMLTYKRVWLL
jgi:cystathionine beta-lyase/cystathionine gamma-synthase